MLNRDESVCAMLDFGFAFYVLLALDWCRKYVSECIISSIHDTILTTTTKVCFVIYACKIESVV